MVLEVGGVLSVGLGKDENLLLSSLWLCGNV